ncbi:MAG TPA: Rne/Rng family ribonuclease [Actinomycetota bacterium]|nr:Rne/Rng family ribonuclease [Actinomycetota bacterium]
MSDPSPRKREKASELPRLEEVASPAEPPGNAPAEGGQPPRRRSRRRPAQQRDAAPASPAGEKTERSPDSEDGERTRRGGSTRRGRGRGGRGRRSPRTNVQQTDRVMLVHAKPGGIQIGVLEENQIVEHYVARDEDRSIVGNVYLGRVQNVLPGMEASFIDIGESRNGVLYAGEVGIAGDEGDEVPRIETVLKSGQSILVQVTKDPMKSKGARLTALVSIAGRHLVLVPNARSLGVSRRLSDSERGRLRDIVNELRPSEHGLIVRTAAEGAGREDLKRDLERVVQTWETIRRKSQGVKAPALVYEEPELEMRVVRDLFNRDVTRCIVDDDALAEKLRDYVRSTSSELEQRIETYDGKLPIFEEFRVVEQIRKSLDRKVWLPSGGHLVIDRTEAMTVIDVNTGKFVGKSNLEETVFRTNKEAAVEVGRQLRLRDIGGIIVIDFIDMEDLGNRDEVIKLFRKELGRDRTRTQVFDISPLGLVQMTRKNVSAGIVEAFSDPCPTCEGRGILIHDVD